ncbi:carbohydrate ABC transporter permease [Paenibacillus sp. p3-SID867]|uniref:carbohydrate ABC transporter permease n=1 Tax=Paenibacillus sp. p3-SID867 TaxID=2916363 RepID=UPI0021A53DEA|nr:carbohydrate ABC transporter permease [Paenibacillus sp. p3-SID867]MCT1402116.1 carbohydrate ABC transporter permease [Paenibacillus sp. p3-SID867]
MRHLRGLDLLFTIMVYSFLLLAAAMAIFPLFYVLSVSFSTEYEYLTRGFFVIPKQFTLDGYLYLLSHPGFISAFRNAVIISAVGTALNIVLTSLMAYGLSKRWLKFRNSLNFMVFFTMLFSGGMIPTYLVVRSLHLLDSFWAIWLSTAIAPFNVIVMRSFFQSMPLELEESARMDGSGEWRLFLSMIVPLSMPVIATFTLFYLVTNWNTYFSAILYLNDAKLMPLQVFLRQMLVEDDPTISNATNVLYKYTPAAKMAAIILTALPLLVIYPFMQKHFNQGAMLGSIKG